MTISNSPRSPIWTPGSKRLIVMILLLLAFLLLIRISHLLIPFIMALILAYLVEPVVKILVQYARLPRLLALALVYLGIVAALISIPVSALPPIITQVNNLINNMPRYLRQLGVLLQEPITIARVEIPIDQLPLDQLYASLSTNLISVIQTVGGQSLSLFGSVATATLSTVGWTLLVLFLSFYLVKDHEQLFRSVMSLVPDSYQQDMYRLSHEMSLTWDAFLRGQLLLCVVMGGIIFLLALVIGLPNALLLAIIAGVAELLPTIGPILAAIPAALIAFFQSEASWLGRTMSPFWFMMLVIGAYFLVNQLENYFLVPRIMGYHLKLHPLVVVLAAVAGASIAGFLGILLAAPLLASGRLIFMYIYHKLTDQPPFPDTADEVRAAERVVNDSAAEQALGDEVTPADPGRYEQKPADFAG